MTNTKIIKIGEEIRKNGAKIKECESIIKRSWSTRPSAEQLKTEAGRAAWKAAQAEREEAAKKANAEITLLKMTNAILKDNAIYILMQDLQAAAVEVFAKYSGKPYGEKTRERIAEEIKERTGARVYIDTRFYWSVDDVNIYAADETIDFLRGDDLPDIYTAYDNEKKSRPALLIDNKIDGEAVETLNFIGSRKYTEQPKKAAKKLVADFEKVEKAYKKAEAMRAEFNNNAPRAGFERLNATTPRAYLF